jgi:viroplasmin and RNaseH domain-containing protein
MQTTANVLLNCHSNEAKAEVTGYSSACHKSFETQDQAEAFNTNYEKAKRYISAIEISPDTTLESIMGQLVIN